MKSKTSAMLIVWTALLGLMTSFRADAQPNEPGRDPHRYKFVDVGTLGGPVSYLTNDQTGTGSASGILSHRGMVVSAADTSIPDPNYPNSCLLCELDPLVVHAFQWHNGTMTDLGALPGVNSSGANWISENGLIAGFSENGAIDPLLGVPETEAVLWKEGQIVGLGTIEGGYESAAFAVNSRGQVVGGVVNTIPDPFSPFGLQVRAFLWQNGVMEDLGTLGGADATANFVNHRGQIVGTSFTNSTPNPVTGLPTQDPFLWQDGTMHDLGTLGGAFGTPNYLDNRGRVIGQSNLAGDLSEHPFLWERGVLTDLGTFGGENGQANWMNEAGEIIGFATNQGDQALFAFLWKDGVLTNLGTVRGDACSAALGINSRSQVVGVSARTCSFTAADRHAFLWESGRVTDLNTFLPPGADLQQLTNAYNINDRGEIVGLGVPPGCGDEFACGRIFVLIPCVDDDARDDEGCRDDDAATSVDGIHFASVSASSTATAQTSVTMSEMRDRVRAYLSRQNRRFLGFQPK